MATNNDQAKADAKALEEQQNAAAAAARADVAAREAAAKLDPATAPYTVAKGSAITSVRGILADGQPVTEADFAFGAKPTAAEVLADLVKRKLVIKSA